MEVLYHSDIIPLLFSLIVFIIMCKCFKTPLCAVEQWGRSFAAMNIGYKGATMDLDLLDRKGKYSNGFCHWPQESPR